MRAAAAARMKSNIDTGALDVAKYLAGGEHGEEKKHKTLEGMFYVVDHEAEGNDNTVLIGSYGNKVIIERENQAAAEVTHPAYYEVRSFFVLSDRLLFI